MKLGELIRARRKKLGLKVKDLAKEVGIHPVYMTQIEKHNKLPSPAVYNNIEKILGTNLRKIYLKEKYPKLSKQVGSPISQLFMGSGDDFGGRFIDFVCNSNDTDYGRIALELVKEFTPAKKEDTRLINNIAKVVEGLRRKHLSFQQEYKRGCSEVKRLLKTL